MTEIPTCRALAQNFVLLSNVVGIVWLRSGIRWKLFSSGHCLKFQCSLLIHNPPWMNNPTMRTALVAITWKDVTLNDIPTYPIHFIAQSYSWTRIAALVGVTRDFFLQHYAMVNLRKKMMHQLDVSDSVSQQLHNSVRQMARNSCGWEV